MKTELTGLYGHAEQFDLKTVRERTGRIDTTLVAWRIYAPWANCMWHSYALMVYHLRPQAGIPQPFIYLSGATHEVSLFALHPERECKLDEANMPILMPINFAAQFISTDDEAVEKINGCVMEILNGVLSPDTDYTQQWIARFNASMIKGDVSRVGETIIRTKIGDRITEVVHDPKFANAMPDTNPPWMKDNAK